MKEETKLKPQLDSQLTLDDIARQNRQRAVNSELGSYVPSTNLTLKAEEESQLRINKSPKLSQQFSVKDIEKKCVKMAVERAKNSSVMNLDGNRLSMLGSDPDIVHNSSNKAKTRRTGTMWSNLPSLR